MLGHVPLAKIGTPTLVSPTGYVIFLFYLCVCVCVHPSPNKEVVALLYYMYTSYSLDTLSRFPTTRSPRTSSISLQMLRALPIPVPRC